MTTTMTYAHTRSSAAKAVDSGFVVVGSGIVLGLEAWGAVLCFQAGGGWAILGVILCLFMVSGLFALLGGLVKIWS